MPFVLTVPFVPIYSVTTKAIFPIVLQGEQALVEKINLTHATGAPVLEGSLASFDCKLLHDVLVGTHRIFIGQVEHVTCGGTGNPLLYHGRQYAAPMALIA